MTKKIMAFLTAVLCISSLTAMTVSADYAAANDYVAYEAEDDRLVVEYNFSVQGLYVNTGGVELTRDMVEPFYPNYGEFYGDEDYTNPDFSCNKVTAVPWKDIVATDFDDFNVLIDLDENGYYINCEADERMEVLARRLMIEYDFIEDVQILTTKSMTTDGSVDIEFTMYPTFVSEDVDPSALDIPELKDFYFKDGVYKMTFPEWDFEGDYLEWFCNVTMPDFFNEFHAANPQYNDLRFEYVDGGMAGVRNVYDSYQSFKWLMDYCDAIVEKYPDVFADLVPVPAGSSSTVQCIDGTVCWDEYVGDSNTDGAVDAQDAADVLSIAAQIGTGADIKATSANDVNADGTVDASDAAAVLSYAAVKGTGADVSWIDILRK